MRKITALWLALLLLLTGCSETDVNYVPSENNEEYCDIEENISWDEVYQPGTCAVYTAKQWVMKDSKVIKEVMQEDSDSPELKIKDAGEGLGYTIGKKYLFTGKSGYTDADKEKWDDMAHGQILFRNHAYDKILSGQILSNSDEFKQQDQRRQNIESSGNMKKNKDLTTYADTAEKLLERLDVPNYEVDDVIFLKKTKKPVTVLYMSQKIDRIPVCQVTLERRISGEGDRVIYNSYIGYDESQEQYRSNLETYFVGDKMQWFGFEFALTDFKRDIEKELVPCEKAYQAARQKCLEEVGKTADKICLEKARLEYKAVGNDEKVYLYPVWNFIFRAKGDLFKTAEEASELNNENENKPIEGPYRVYLIDAYTGEFFKNIDGVVKNDN